MFSETRVGCDGGHKTSRMSGSAYATPAAGPTAGLEKMTCVKL